MLTVEDGSGLSDAESYTSIAEADSYHSDYGNDDWPSTSSPDNDLAAKEAALRRATRWIDGFYHSRFIGERANSNQALEWPRLNGFDSSDFLVASDEIPAGLKNAVAEAALLEFGTPGTLSQTLERGGMVLEAEAHAGPVGVKDKFAHGAPVRTTYTVISDLLKRYLEPASHDTVRA